MLLCQQDIAVETDRSESPLSTSDNQPSTKWFKYDGDWLRLVYIQNQSRSYLNHLVYSLLRPISSTSTYVLSSDFSLCLPSKSQSSKKLPRYIHSTCPHSLLDLSALRFVDFFKSRSYSFRARVNCRTTAVCQSCEGPRNIATYCNKNGCS